MKLCPTCGMTTSVSHLVRGEVGAAWGVQPFGVIASVVCVGAAVAFVVLQTIVDGVLETLGASWGELLILNDALDEVVERNTAGLDGKQTSAAELHAGIGGWVLKNEQPTSSPSAQTVPRNTR